jgi:hypothetical protein
LGLPEFDGCQALNGLVDRALVEVIDPARPVVQVVKTPAPEVSAEDTVGAPAADEIPRSREALNALLEVIPSDSSPAVVDTHDGLADRGPWTSTELASLDQTDGERQEEVAATDAVGAVEATEHAIDHAPDMEVDPAIGADETGDPSGQTDGETDPEADPINRGMLLKFLSSVRS